MTDQPNGNRRVFAIVMGITLAILFALFFLGGYMGAWDKAQGAARYVIPERFQQELIDLDKKALNEVYINHVDKLWGNWVSQVSNLGHDTSRIDVGFDHLHQAWVIAMERIEKREKALKDKCAGC